MSWPAGPSSVLAHFVVFGRFYVFLGSISACFQSPGRNKRPVHVFFSANFVVLRPVPVVYQPV